jgi:hypothetical protein
VVIGLFYWGTRSLLLVLRKVGLLRTQYLLIGLLHTQLKRDGAQGPLGLTRSSNDVFIDVSHVRGRMKD